MKMIKLAKRDYYDLPHLLKKAGLVKEPEAFPDQIFVNSATLAEMKQKYLSALKKENPNINKQHLLYSVEMEFLNLGPSVLSSKNGGNLLPKGHAIVLTDKAEGQSK